MTARNCEFELQTRTPSTDDQQHVETFEDGSQQLKTFDDALQHAKTLENGTQHSKMSKDAPQHAKTFEEESQPSKTSGEGIQHAKSFEDELPEQKTSGDELQHTRTFEVEPPNRKNGIIDVIHPPDGGWGWVVCAASFWSNGIIIGLLNTFGVMYPEMLKVYGSNDDDSDIAFKISWVGSLSTGMTFFISPVTSILVDRCGIRPIAFIGPIIGSIGLLASSFVQQVELLYLCYGFLFGLGASYTLPQRHLSKGGSVNVWRFTTVALWKSVGASLTYSPSLVILGHYFKTRLGLVNGLVTTGAAVFTVALPFLLKFLFESIGLHYTLQIIAGLNCTLGICALTYRPIIPPRNYNDTSKSPLNAEPKYPGCVTLIQRYLNVNIWRNRRYVVWVLAMSVSFLGYYVPFVHLVKHVNDTMPEKNGEILVMCIGAASGVGRLVAGKLADMRRMNPIRMHQLSFSIMGIATIVIPFATYFEVLIGLSLLMGIFDGVMMCLIGPIAFTIVGQRDASQAVGFLLGCLSIPLMSGPPIAGFMYDTFGNYNAAFWGAGGFTLLGASLMFLIPRQKPQTFKKFEEFTVAVEEQTP